MITRAMLDTKRSLHVLLPHLSEAVNSDLSMDMIKPQKFMSLLTDITKRLEGNLALPYEISGISLLKYCKHLHPLVISDGDTFHIALALPLVDHASKYNVYEILSVPNPEPKGSLSAIYHIEGDYVTVSSDKNQFACISKHDFGQCHSEIICKLNIPLYYLLILVSCVMAPHLKDKSRYNKIAGKYTEKHLGFP